MQKYAGADWLRRPGVQVSEFGALVADMLAHAYQGIYHLPGARTADFSQDAYVRVFVQGDLATFDSDKLTTLVLLAHHCAVRMAIEPHSQHGVDLVFHPRKRDGDYFGRHPSIEQVVARFKAMCELPEAQAAAAAPPVEEALP